MENRAIRVETVPVGMLQTNCYIVSREGRGDCVLVDPGADARRILAEVGEKRIAAVLLTHGHFDHVGAVEGVMQEGTRLYIHEADEGMLRDPATNASWMIGRRMTVNAKAQTVREGDVIDAAGMNFTVLHTPGHTMGSSCFLAEDVLLTGDTLFHADCGRTDLPGGSDADMARSLKRLAKLTHGKMIYPGHG